VIFYCTPICLYTQHTHHHFPLFLFLPLSNCCLFSVSQSFHHSTTKPSMPTILQRAKAVIEGDRGHGTNTNGQPLYMRQQGASFHFLLPIPHTFHPPRTLQNTLPVSFDLVDRTPFAESYSFSNAGSQPPLAQKSQTTAPYADAWLFSPQPISRYIHFAVEHVADAISSIYNRNLRPTFYPSTTFLRLYTCV
jgi:hypothetical protein